MKYVKTATKINKFQLEILKAIGNGGKIKKCIFFNRFGKRDASLALRALSDKDIIWIGVFYTDGSFHFDQRVADEYQWVYLPGIVRNILKQFEGDIKNVGE
jgi:hypothetical protein